jgi:iron complex transport system permease protein
MLLKTRFSWVLFTGALICLFLFDLALGSVEIPLFNIINILSLQENGTVASEIVWNFRMTKALTCILAGGALALAGMQMQTLFRNPLAGPDVLGLTSGASLMVALIYLASLNAYLPSLSSSISIVIGATLGCLFVFLIMLFVSMRLSDNASLLIVGLMVGAGTSSVVSVLQYATQAEKLQTFILWSFGSLGALNWLEIKILGAILFAGGMLALMNTKALNGWLFGELYATSIGVNIRSARILMIISASILTGGVTAFCGPIAFVGLAVPHLLKMLFKTNDHKLLIPGSLLGGAILLLFCDLVSQLPGDTVLPINAITALIGAPVVIWIILKNRAAGVS